MAKSKKKNKPSGKIIDALPDALKPKLNKPRLRDLTFADLATVDRIMGQFWDNDPQTYAGRGCTACKWFG
jgi:hypothetical protein